MIMNRDFSLEQRIKFSARRQREMASAPRVAGARGPLVAWDSCRPLFLPYFVLPVRDASLALRLLVLILKYKVYARFYF